MKKEMRRKNDVHFSAVQYFMETQMDYFNFQLCDRLKLEQCSGPEEQDNRTMCTVDTARFVA